MEPFRVASLPRPFALANVGASCHFNALMQGLASCPAFVDAVCDNADYLRRTPTGAALHEFGTACRGDGADPLVASKLLAAMVAALRGRRPHTDYGISMQSATEGLVLLLEMIEPADAPLGEGAPANPILEPFRTVMRERVLCRGCKDRVVSEKTDTTYQRHYFDYDSNPPQTAEEFATGLQVSMENLSDYKCGVCGSEGLCARVEDVRRLPAVYVVLFNQYGGFRRRFFPTRFTVPAVGGRRLIYRLVAQVENGGGHYWTHGLRRAGNAGDELCVARLDDMSVGPGSLGPYSSTVYTVFYHYIGSENS